MQADNVKIKSLKGDIGGHMNSNSRWDSKEGLDSLFVDDPHLYLAKHDFIPTGAGQLAIKRGDKITVKGYNEQRDWCEAEAENGLVGWVPSSYVAKMDSLENTRGTMDQYPELRQSIVSAVASMVAFWFVRVKVNQDNTPLA